MNPSMDGSAFATSPNGFTDHELGFEWVSKVFHPSTVGTYLTRPNILYVRDAIRELDKKKSDEIDKMWRSHKRDIKKLLKDVGERLEQPPQSSSPIVPNLVSSTSSELYIIDPYSSIGQPPRIS
jgi:hypothetical protein